MAISGKLDAIDAMWREAEGIKDVHKEEERKVSVSGLNACYMCVANDVPTEI